MPGAARYHGAAGARGDWEQVSQALNVKDKSLAALREWLVAHAANPESAEVAWASRSGVELAHALWNAGRLLTLPAAMRDVYKRQLL